MKRFALSLLLAVALLGASHAVIKRDAMDVLRESQEAFEKRDFDRAVTLLTEAIEANPKLTPAFVLRGLANASRNKFDEAVADYTKASELAPDDERPRLLRAAVHQFRKEYDKAIKDIDFALKKDPKNSELLATRGVCRAQKGDDDGALSDFDAAVKADPKNVHGLQLRGSAYSEKGEKDKALGDFKEAIALDPNNAATYLYRAHLYLVEADPDLALADLEEVMRRAPDFPGAANRGRFSSPPPFALSASLLLSSLTIQNVNLGVGSYPNDDGRLAESDGPVEARCELPRRPTYQNDRGGFGYPDDSAESAVNQHIVIHAKPERNADWQHP